MISTTKKFLDDYFLLENDSASFLYHKVAAKLPIIDYHNHLSPKDIAENRQFDTITQLWLDGDHYKWRAMRTNGIDEKYCTGDAQDYEKFEKWAQTVPYTLRNPLYHWTHLELKNYFGIDQILNGKTAKSIYDLANQKIQSEEYSVQGLLKKMKVEVICTTDDPTDTLAYHQKMQNHEWLRMYPTFRPDQAYQFDQPVGYNQYLDKLAKITNSDILTIDQLILSLKSRCNFFDKMGCRSADHGLEYMPSISYSPNDADNAFKSIRYGNTLDPHQKDGLRGFILKELSKMYHKLGWVQQFHLGAMRNNNDRMMKALGPDTGFDSIGDFPQARSLAQFLAYLDKENRLPKTILYNLNPADNEVFASMAGNFNDGSIPGKIQYGAAWWFLDQKDGMEKQLNAMSNLGLISHFVGMVTDSRSFLSFPRHEYFRRTLCNIIGKDVQKGELPADTQLLTDLISGICYTNAKTYFNL